MPAPIPGIMSGARLKSGLTLPPPAMQANRFLSPAAARRLDLNAEELGVPVHRLMDNAGKALAQAAQAAASRAPKTRRGHSILFLCGKGNNGGDGFAAAAHLQAQGIAAHVVLAEPAARIRSQAARSHFARLARGSVSVWTGRPKSAWTKSPVLVDCLLGSGLSGPPQGPYRALITWANRQRRHIHVLACDVPSGLGTPIAIVPHATVTFHAPKQGMTPGNSGRIRVAPIGIPAQAATRIGLGDLDAAYRRPAWDSHKGDNGLIAVIAGSTPLLGASHYVTRAAYRTGADLVHLAVPPQAAPTLRTWSPDGIVHATGRPGSHGGHLTPDALPAIEALLDRCTAAVVGPGLGRHKSTLAATRQVLAACADRDLPVVVDADGLDALDTRSPLNPGAAALLRRHGGRILLTPHAREFQDLCGRAATRANVQAYARAHGVTVLRKSAVDVVSDGARTLECHRGHPTLTVGGTGDVLAGTAATLLAKGASPFEAGCGASYLVKCAGEVAASMRSYGATALDVADAIPSVLLRLP